MGLMGHFNCGLSSLIDVEKLCYGKFRADFVSLFKKKSQLYDIQNYKVVIAVVFTMKLLKTEGCFD